MANSRKSRDDRKRRSKRKKRKRSDNTKWKANQNVSDDHSSEEEEDTSGDEESDDDHNNSGEEECVICRGLDNEDGMGQIYRVCGCTGWGLGYHFPCVVMTIKNMRDRPCICGQQFRHPRIRRVHRPTMEMLRRCLDFMSVIQSLALLNFVAYVLRIIFNADTLHGLVRYMLSLFLLVIVIYLLSLIFENFWTEWRQQYAYYYLEFTHIRPDGSINVEEYRFEDQVQAMDDQEGGNLLFLPFPKQDGDGEQGNDQPFI